MAKKKQEFWKVIVMANNGPVFVTKTNNWERTAEWNKKEKPMSFSKEDAQYLAWALSLNGHLAFATGDTWDIDNQPYNYNYGNFYWRNKKVKENEQITN